MSGLFRRFAAVSSTAVLSVTLLAPIAVAAPVAASALYYAPTFAPTASTAGTASTAAIASTVQSADWAGWDVTGGTYTSVSASWTEPTVTCATDETSYSAFWVGLDGDGSSSVEQIGTSANCDAGVAAYSSWYEFYPDVSVTLPNTVEPGDKLSASVKFRSDGTYALTVTDSTGKWTKTETGTAPQGTNASAEVVAEAPSSSRQEGVLPLADFKSVAFSNVDVNGAAIGTISTATPIDMVSQDTGSVQAAVSLLTKANAFTVDFKSTGDDTTGLVSSEPGSSTGAEGSTGWGNGGGWSESGSGTSATGGTGTDGGWGYSGYGSDPFGDSSSTDPSSTDPYSTDPNSTDPNSTNPNSTDPNSDSSGDTGNSGALGYLNGSWGEGSQYSGWVSVS